MGLNYLALAVPLLLILMGLIMPDLRSWIFYLGFLWMLIVVIAIGVFCQNNFITSLLLILVSLLVYHFSPIQKRYLALLYQRRS